MIEPQEVEILLVEDKLDDAELTVHVLRLNNLVNHIEVVRDGEEALDFLFCKGAFKERSFRPPRLVLLDLKLPKVDGLEVIRQIKADRRTKAVPVVVMTSSCEEKDMVESYRLGVNSYIPKPVDFEQFRETVKQLGLYWLLVNRAPPQGALRDAETGAR